MCYPSKMASFDAGTSTRIHVPVCAGKLLSEQETHAPAMRHHSLAAESCCQLRVLQTEQKNAEDHIVLSGIPDCTLLLLAKDGWAMVPRHHLVV